MDTRDSKAQKNIPQAKTDRLDSAVRLSGLTGLKPAGATAKPLSHSFGLGSRESGGSRDVAETLGGWMRKTAICLALALLAADQARAQFGKWEVSGLLGVLPPTTLDRSPLAAQIRGRLSALQLSEARSLAARLIRQEPQNYEGYFWTGFVELQQGDLYPAVRSLRHAERLQPPGNAVQKVLGLVYLELDQRPLFELKMREAAARDPADFSPHYCLGRYLQSQKSDHEQAAKQYHLVLERKPDHYEALYYLGLAFETRGDLVQAKALYERALAASEGVRKTFSLPYQGLSRLNRAGNRLEDALGFASRAASLEPKLPDNQLELAKVYTALGQLPEAVDALKASIAVDSAQSSPYYQLFSLYRRMGDAKAAEQALSDFQHRVACYGKE